MGTGIDKLTKLLEDSEITEIMINDVRNTFVEIAGKKQRYNVSFSQEEIEQIRDYIFTVSGKQTSGNRPYLDSCLPDGSRVNVILPPLARLGAAITIRKFLSGFNSIEDLISKGTLNRDVADFLIAGVKGKLNMLFAGATGAGKTTTLEVLSRYIPNDERIIVIEDTAELELQHENLVSLETKLGDEHGIGEVSLRDLIKNALRMRPDRIIIGEVRGAEALDMVQAMSTGHKGTMGVIHGSSPREVISRLETLILTSGITLPVSEIRKMIADALDLIVFQERFDDGVRRISYITEIRDIYNNALELHEIFEFDIRERTDDGKISGEFKPVIKSYPKFYNNFLRSGLLKKDILMEAF